MRRSCDGEETRRTYLLVAEVVAYTLSKNVLRCDQETSSGFRHEQALREKLVQTYEGAKLA